MGVDIEPPKEPIDAFAPRSRVLNGDVFNRVLISVDPESPVFMRVELLHDHKQVNVLSMRLKTALDFLEKTFSNTITVREALETKAITFPSYKDLDFESVEDADDESAEGWVFFGDEKEACEFAVFAETLTDVFGITVCAPMQMEEAPHDWAVLIEDIPA